MKTDLSPDTDVSLLPRADLPVIWDSFRAKAEALKTTAETLTVTCITQKEEMALARTTRLTLREIRIAVENKRVELGESHLKEIKKVNGAATAIKEFIQPLEARLLIQESFAEQHEILRIAELSKSRNAEVLDLRRNFLFSGNIGALSQEEYDILLANLKQEKAEIETANRLRIEAEKRLAEQAIEMRRQEEAFLEKLQAEKVAENQRAEAARILAQQERDAANWKAQQEREAAEAIAEAKAQEVYADLKRKNEAEHAIRVIEALRLDNERAAKAAEEKRLWEEADRANRAAFDAAETARRIERQAEEAKRLELEAELAQANAAKQAEEKRVMELAIAPDVEKLWQFAGLLRGIQVPGMVTHDGIEFASGIYEEIKSLAFNIEETCKSWGLTGK